MQEIQAHFVELANKSEKSITQIAKEALVGESTVRRFLRGEDISVNSLGKIAAAVGATTEDLEGYIPAKTAVAVEIMKQEIEQEFKPYTAQCATACPARKAFNENLAHIEALYEVRLAERKDMYERALQGYKRREKFKTITIIVLAVMLAVYALYFDARNGDWGFIRFASTLFQESIPQVFKM